jgi:hypothetical protein
MQAYEFSSVINNDGLIHIPEQYREKISSPVRIILLSEDISQNKNNRGKKFTAIKLKTKGFQFDRETANE